MSTLDPSIPRPPAPNTDPGTVVATCRQAVAGAAFWASIPLPLVIAATLVTGAVTTAPLLVVGLVLLNVCCAALGQFYSINK